MDLDFESKSAIDIEEIPLGKMITSYPHSLEHQIFQLNEEKMILLNQIADLEVTVCFSCREKIPKIETKLENMNKHCLEKLKKLRANYIRLNNKYKSERDRLLLLEEELKMIQRKSLDAQKEIDQKNTFIELLRDEIHSIQKQKEIFSAIKMKDAEKLNELKKEKHKFQGENKLFDYKEDCIYIKSECDDLKKQITELQNERTELENELFILAKYNSQKEVELKKLKEILNNIHTEVRFTCQAIEAANKKHNKLRKKSAISSQNIEEFRNKITTEHNEFEKFKETLNQLIESKEKIEEEQNKVRCEIIDLGVGTKRLQNILNDYKSQRTLSEQQLAKEKEDLASINLKLYKLKDELKSSEHECCCLDTQLAESQDLHETLRLKLVQEFTTSRLKLRQLREQRDNDNQEIEHLISPAMQERKDILEHKKKFLVQIENEIFELEDLKVTKMNHLANLKNGLNKLLQHCNEEERNIKEVTAKRIKNEKTTEESENCLDIGNIISLQNSKFTGPIHQLVQKYLSIFDDEINNLRQCTSDSNFHKEFNPEKHIQKFIELLKEHFAIYMDENFQKHTTKNHDNKNIDLISLATLQERRDQLKYGIESFECEIESLNSELDKLKEQVQKKTAEAEKLRQISISAENDYQEKEKILNNIRKKQTETERDILYETEKLKNVQHRYETLVEEIHNTEKETVKQESKLEYAMSKLMKNQEKEAKKRADLKKIIAEIQQLEINIQNQRKKRSEYINIYSQEKYETSTKNRYNESHENCRNSLEDLIVKANRGTYPCQSTTNNTQPEHSIYTSSSSASLLQNITPPKTPPSIQSAQNMSCAQSDHADDSTWEPSLPEYYFTTDDDSVNGQV